MSVCPKCGNELGDWTFCNKCGTNVEEYLSSERNNESSIKSAPQKEIRKCPKCGNEIGDWTFCNKCGTRVVEHIAQDREKPIDGSASKGQEYNSNNTAKYLVFSDIILDYEEYLNVKNKSEYKNRLKIAISI